MFDNRAKFRMSRGGWFGSRLDEASVLQSASVVLHVVRCQHFVSSQTRIYPWQAPRQQRARQQVRGVLVDLTPAHISCFPSAPAKSGAKDNKAKAAKKAALQGTHSHAKRKPRLSVTFRRPKTLKLPRKPKYPRTSIPHAPRMDEYRTVVS